MKTASVRLKPAQYFLNSEKLRTRMAALCLVMFLAQCAISQTNETMLTVRGEVEQPLSLTVADLQAMRGTNATVTEKSGREARFDGVVLYELVNRAKPKLSEHCCSNAVNTVVIVTAADNYQAIFSLPELDPKFRHRNILLAYARDGQPMKPPIGPLEIIVPDEAIHARWVREVKEIDIVPIGSLSTNSYNDRVSREAGK